MRKIILLAFVIFGTISCNQDLLDEVDEKVLAESVVFSDLVLTRAYVDATYREVLVGQGFQGNTLDAYSDNVHYVQNAGSYDFLGGVMDPDNVKPINGDLWWVTYKSVRRINIFFKAIESSPLSESNKNLLTAEMKFLRAWTYARAIDHYGGVVIYEDVFDLSNQDFKKPRNTYEECLAYVIKDLDDAAAVLPMRDMSGRASGIAALALKSRVLLSAASLLHNPTKDQSKWLAANQASKAVIDIIGANSLHPNYAEVFQKTTVETIWARNHTIDNGHNVNTRNNPNGYNGWGGNTPLQGLV
ncbi:MAG: RagB/SusD family nutrient uptake outer membrane protein, partial [Candidatus Sericytochromatia bacterium]